MYEKRVLRLLPLQNRGKMRKSPFVKIALFAEILTENPR